MSRAMELKNRNFLTKKNLFFPNYLKNQQGKFQKFLCQERKVF